MHSQPMGSDIRHGPIIGVPLCFATRCLWARYAVLAVTELATTCLVIQHSWYVLCFGLLSVLIILSACQVFVHLNICAFHGRPRVFAHPANRKSGGRNGQRKVYRKAPYGLSLFERRRFQEQQWRVLMEPGRAKRIGRAERRRVAREHAACQVANLHIRRSCYARSYQMQLLQARRGYGLFHNVPTDSVDTQRIHSSSAGIDGWSSFAAHIDGLKVLDQGCAMYGESQPVQDTKSSEAWDREALALANLCVRKYVYATYGDKLTCTSQTRASDLLRKHCYTMCSEVFAKRGGGKTVHPHPHGAAASQELGVLRMAALVQPAIYELDVQKVSGLNPFLDMAIARELRSLRTNGDGACAMHALFGVPCDFSGRQELFLHNARERAVALLGPSLEILAAREDIVGAVRDLKTSLWHEFVVSHLNGAPSQESTLFWSSMERLVPHMCVEARNVFNENRAITPVYEAQQQAAIHASRQYFHCGFEAMIVRPVAVLLGYIPAGVNVLSLSEDHREALAEEYTFLEECFYYRGGRKHVRGTQEIFPDDGPTCKYSALFDQRPEFDAIRAAFFAAERDVLVFLQKLESVIENWMDNWSEEAVLRTFTFRDAIAAFAHSAVPLGEPANFAERAWAAYLDSVKASSYYFSVSEMIIIASNARQNVAFFLANGSTLEYEGGYFGGVGDVILIKLQGNRCRRVDSHFERMMTAQTALDLLGGANADTRSEYLMPPVYY